LSADCSGGDNNVVGTRMLNATRATSKFLLHFATRKNGDPACSGDRD